MLVEPFGRLDQDSALRQKLLPCCRLKKGDIWVDPASHHRIGVCDATKKSDILNLFGKEKATLAIQDPPYNVIVGNENTHNLCKMNLHNYMAFSQQWVENTLVILADHASIYVWLGADQKDHFQPLPDFMMLMRNYDELTSRSFITMRNQRGYGTQKNWMAVRQECLYYTKGQAFFDVNAEYTDIPKILRGYYKEINGQVTENLQRSKSENIRAGNVWVDVQQVFYRMPENVPGCYAQKPMKAIERIVKASSQAGDVITDFFTHSGTTLIVGELLKRRVISCDIDEIFAEITIRRLEHFRKTGKTGWQCGNPFPEVKEFRIENLDIEEDDEIPRIQTGTQTTLF
ncbi:site-specific DNA-methyltransferase [Candidatus Dojkabacteria bacterium]|nr:site-specific DNA-methyltransferase [Candidatus Dojkabacteria bacterium]